MKKVGGIAGWVFKNSSFRVFGDCRLEARNFQSIHDHHSSSSSSDSDGAKHKSTPSVQSKIFRLFGRDKPVHHVLGGGKCMKSNGVRVLGLFGMGGVGKTTLAKALFNRVVVDFEHRSFISSVREASSKVGGLIALRNRIISDISTQMLGNVAVE
ncbi:hypothetical protein K1719_042087 [Acacia pycnantha]|nr:hypothetical protein K1719_042087 [Acacia pycnantha]